MAAPAQVTPMADGFLGRWSQRKQAQREGKNLDEKEPLAQVQQALDATENRAIVSSLPAPLLAGEPELPMPGVTPTRREAGPANGVVAPQAKPAPTLADVQALTSDASFAPFVGRDVAPEVRNAAMKKLFADPHYNVMDGLDIYIDDYAKPSPLPAALLRQMVSAQFLKLVDEPEAPAANAKGEDGKTLSPHSVTPPPLAPPLTDSPTPDAAAPVAPVPDTLPAHHDHTDLRLQPNHAASGHEPGRGPE